ncbi:MAG: hypothetical protein ACT6RZ_08890 [Methylophilus sp.]|uniref:hypothetical protein n=1 Tax=Methylophilus sp. TaxID=29541 RepID=UPI004036ACBE
MTTDSNIEKEKLIRFVQDLKSFEFYTKLDGNYNHIGATIADAVLQANNKYSTNVKPRILRILAVYPEIQTTKALKLLLNSITVTDLLNWRGEDRAMRFQSVLDLFEAESIESEVDLQAWLLVEDNLSKLRKIHGIGPKTVDYFKILVGIKTNAIDRHLLNFLALANIKVKNYLHAQNVINETADYLEVDRALFDHSIWQYMSKNSAMLELRNCFISRTNLR